MGFLGADVGQVAGAVEHQQVARHALRQHRPATTTFDLAAQALLFESDEMRRRMTGFLDRRRASPA